MDFSIPAAVPDLSSCRSFTCNTNRKFTICGLVLEFQTMGTEQSHLLPILRLVLDPRLSSDWTKYIFHHGFHIMERLLRLGMLVRDRVK